MHHVNGAIVIATSGPARSPKPPAGEQGNSSNFYKIFSKIASNRTDGVVFHDPLDSRRGTNLIDTTKHSHRVTRLYGVQPGSGCCGYIEVFLKKSPAVAAAGR